MKPIVFLMVAVASLASIAAFGRSPSGNEREEASPVEASPIYGVTIPPGYRDWNLISVTHEEGDFNQLRAQLGNDIAIKAYREGKSPSMTAQLLSRCIGSEFPRTRTTKSLATSRRSLQDLRRICRS